DERKVRQQRRPAAAIPVPLLLTAAPEPLPAAMLDLKAGRDVVGSEEPNLDLGRVGPVASEVPEVTEAERRLPDRDLSPVVLDAARRPLEDPAPEPDLREHALCRLPRAP